MSDEPDDDDIQSGNEQGFDPDHEISDDEAEQIEEERQERLDPENRPTNAEVDNTQREFDPENGGFQVDGEDVENGPVIGADRPDDVEVVERD